MALNTVQAWLQARGDPPNREPPLQRALAFCSNVKTFTLQ